MSDEGEIQEGLEKPNMQLDKENNESLADNVEKMGQVLVSDRQLSKENMMSNEREEENNFESGVSTTISQETAGNVELEQAQRGSDFFVSLN